ncbi:MAG: hypothetical protein ACJA08_001586 [Cyclobacteriaceae bacterium]|jgi:hypothetical protein
MGDLLEKYILDHQTDFDDLEPSEKVWKGIQGTLAPTQRDFTYLWKVAAILFLASTIYLVVDRQMDQIEIGEISEVQSEFYEAERYYFQQISNKKSTLMDMHIQDKNADLIEEEEKLNDIYQEMRMQYFNSNSSELVRDALLENLRLRMKILSKQIEVLNEFKYENDENEHTKI